MAQFEFLTPPEIETLTGFILHKKQCEQLRKMGVRYLQNRFGHPIVLRSHLQEICCDGIEKNSLKTADINIKGLMELSKRQ